MIKEYLKKRKERKLEEKKILEEKRKETGIFREYFELISEVLIYVFFVMTFLLQSFVIPTESMVDTILVGDHLIVNKIAYSRSLGSLDGLLLPQQKIESNMIVTFKSPPEMKKEYVKRVIGLPGDLIRIENQKIFVNGKLFDDKFGKYRADYPNNGNEFITDKYKERERFLIIDGIYVNERFRWNKKGDTKLYKRSFFLEDGFVKEDIYKFDLAKNETIYDIDQLLKRRKELISSKDFQISNISFEHFAEKWIRDNFPLDIKDYEVLQSFNDKVDYSKHIIARDGKNYFKVPKGHYFCMGDNRDYSWDSRYWGPVPEDYIIGKPWRIYWSYDADDYLQTGIGNKIKGLMDTVLNFFSKTRWDRTGKLVE